MKLNELIKDMDVVDVFGDLNVQVSDIAYHTNDVKKGCVFVAITGNSADGHDYVHEAIKNGATVIVSSKPVVSDHNVANVIVKNPRRALALMSSRLFGEPSKLFKLIGVTGTNGKTTITYLLESIWKACGLNPGVVGTVNYRYGDVKEDPKHTTPESSELQRLFKKMAGAGIDSVAMEVSSHSLDQNRVFGCHFDGAIFTNLTQDHLDYHLDMERYREAKEKLFKEHLPESSKKNIFTVVNIDDSLGTELARSLKYKVVTYSINKKADVSVIEADYSLTGVRLKIAVNGDTLKLDSGLIGKHNVSNILGAIAAAHAMGFASPKIKEGIEAVKCVPGRLEPVPNSKGLNVLVDYAHTPDAIRNVTTALKELRPKRLITVFGCGGDRDKTKRPLMGFEAALKSDFLVVTSDNPRSEDPKKIIDEIVVGVKKVGLEEGRKNGGYVVEVNREKAIKKAVEMAQTEDVVLIAGKGHENYQIIGRERIVFDDLKVASGIIETL